MKSTLWLSPAVIVVAIVGISIRGWATDTLKHEREAPRYAIVDVGTLGGTFSAARGVNDKGWVSGSSTLPGDLEEHTFLWRNGKMIDLGTLGGPHSAPGFTPFIGEVIVGASEILTPDPNGADFCFTGTQLECVPVVWRGGKIQTLPTLGGANGAANEMNSRGQIAGVAENTLPGPPCFAPSNILEFKPVLYERGEIQELPTFLGDPNGVALAINNQGQVAGFSFSCEDFHALLWHGGILTDLGNLGGTVNNNASAINNRGEVAGVSGLAGNTTSHAFIWRKGVMTDLGTIPGDAGFASVAIGLNDTADVVGQSCNAEDNFCRAFLWRKGAMLDLNTLIPADGPWFLFEADTINSRGQIVGVGFRFDLGEVHGYIATPCGPEHVEADGCANGSSTIGIEHGRTSHTTDSLPARVHDVIRKRRTQRFQVAGTPN